MKPIDGPLQESLGRLSTEMRDPTLADLDRLPIAERLAVQNRLDGEVAAAVAIAIPQIARAVEIIVAAFRSGGRLIYVGAGTSGRLGVLDAAECPPTFGTPPEMVRAVIAGGETALVQAVEGVEDDADAGAAAIRKLGTGERDAVVGITASGRTPFVLGAISEALRSGTASIGVTNNDPSELAALTNPMIAVVVGPELIAGSTRLKAGTAQKLVLNMLTTQAMIEIGKTYGNAMVDVMVTNEKLRARARRLVGEITGAPMHEVDAALAQSPGGSAKVAIAMLMLGIDAADAAEQLRRSSGNLRAALDRAHWCPPPSGRKRPA